MYIKSEEFGNVTFITTSLGTIGRVNIFTSQELSTFAHELNHSF
jgi:hypothetical protein